ncbi:hypothetical protein CGCF415_v009977 [Colletotrichum fructicola]|nr:hypothetical protein CGCFRS4_v015513 [Colletotrichum fructicola]KAF4883692.1 hypothetical protein CGCFRS4_v013333 [Colletotrichum fructicola]KAF4883765.1 hypothetical protein CGCFRS4_v013271 [Colletotrichum fructicola]KAF4889348.1 hypothetical protein CGCF415_v014108 [Colletotrichum fructicola]KAF4889656.1 hypothetical protein CGCFRS4_v009250 [Colletotrichum fructicola]
MDMLDMSYPSYPWICWI